MFSFQFSNLKSISSNNILYYSLLVFCALLPFQFALNPRAGFDLAITRVFIPLLLLGWITVKLKDKKPLFARDKTAYLFITFLLFATLSLFFSHNPFWSLRKLFFLFSIIPIYFIAASLLNTHIKKRFVIVSLVGGATVLAIIAIIQFVAQFIFGIDPVYAFLAHNITPYFLGNSFSQSVLTYPSWLVNAGGITYLRAIAIFPDPHMLSYYLGMLIPWSIALWATSRKYSRLFFFSTIFLTIADVYTFTRSGYLALIAGAIVILPLVSKAIIMKIIIAIAVLTFLFIITPSIPVAGRFTSSFDVNEGSNQGRISNWQQAISIIKNHPFGVGIGMYSLAVDPTADYRKPIYAHNLYLDIAAELGIITTIIFIVIIFTALYSFWNAAKREPFFVAGVSSITIFSIQSLVETPLYSVHVLTLFLIILALSPKTTTHEEIILR